MTTNPPGDTPIPPAPQGGGGMTIRLWGLRLYCWSDVFGWTMLGFGWRAVWFCGLSIHRPERQPWCSLVPGQPTRATEARRGEGE
jgi:hypothetical protein